MGNVHAARKVLVVMLAAVVSTLFAWQPAGATTTPSAVAPPASLPVGMRLTWQAGDATLQGTKLVPDPNGWLWKDEQWWSPQSSGGSGGVGLTQLTIVSSAADAVVADIRHFLNTDLQTNVHVSSGGDLVTGTAEALGDFWIAPAQLAALQSGYDGITRIWRGPRQIGGQTFDTVSSSTLSNGTYSSTTYDVATGMLLLAGTMIASPGVLVTDPSGNVLDSADGAVSLSHRAFVGARQLDIPWAATPPPSWATVGRATTYQGQIRAEYPPSSGMPSLTGQTLTVTQVFDRAVGNAIIGRQMINASNGVGLPPSESSTNRVFASAMFDGMWIPPEHLAALQAQQVLDSDPTTGRTTTFAGVQGGAAVVVDAGPADQLEQYYDVTSGLLVFSRFSQVIPFGTQVTELSFVGQQ